MDDCCPDRRILLHNNTALAEAGAAKPGVSGSVCAVSSGSKDALANGMGAVHSSQSEGDDNKKPESTNHRSGVTFASAELPLWEVSSAALIGFHG